MTASSMQTSSNMYTDLSTATWGGREIEEEGFYMIPSCNQNGHVVAPEYQFASSSLAELVRARFRRPSAT